ncbi:hypothetical protein AQ939_00720 [Burkholderia pseudomallei]|nr:hypothetical protein AQ939_00720 [Burkholderia pseudomallei]
MARAGSGFVGWRRAARADIDRAAAGGAWRGARAGEPRPRRSARASAVSGGACEARARYRSPRRAHARPRTVARRRPIARHIAALPETGWHNDGFPD